MCVSSEASKLVLYEARETGDVHRVWSNMWIVSLLS